MKTKTKSKNAKAAQTRELQQQATAMEALLRAVAGLLHVDTKDLGGVTMATLPAHFARFAAAVVAPVDAALATIPNANLENSYDTDRLDDTIGLTRMIGDLAREFDISHAASTAEVLSGIRDRIRDLKNPGADVAHDVAPGTSITFAAVLRHDARQIQHLTEEVTRARMLIARIAAAMQIDKWDEDGTELLERAQRWDSFRHRLMRSANEWRSQPAATMVDAATVAAHLEFLLCEVIASKEHGRWLQNKPKTVLTPTIMSLLDHQPGIGTWRRWEPMDVTDVAAIVDRGTSGLTVAATFNAIAASAIATGEFVHLMNLVILPILAAQARTPRAAPASEN